MTSVQPPNSAGRSVGRYAGMSRPAPRRAPGPCPLLFNHTPDLQPESANPHRTPPASYRGSCSYLPTLPRLGKTDKNLAHGLRMALTRLGQPAGSADRQPSATCGQNSFKPQHGNDLRMHATRKFGWLLSRRPTNYDGLSRESPARTGTPSSPTTEFSYNSPLTLFSWLLGWMWSNQEGRDPPRKLDRTGKHGSRGRNGWNPNWWSAVQSLIPGWSRA